MRNNNNTIEQLAVAISFYTSAGCGQHIADLGKEAAQVLREQAKKIEELELKLRNTRKVKDNGLSYGDKVRNLRTGKLGYVQGFMKRHTIVEVVCEGRDISWSAYDVERVPEPELRLVENPTETSAITVDSRVRINDNNHKLLKGHNIREGVVNCIRHDADGVFAQVTLDGGEMVFWFPIDSLERLPDASLNHSIDQISRDLDTWG